MAKTFHANGKLLLTGEYFILDGAVGLAVPTIRGQSMTVAESGRDTIEWKGLDHKDEVWFSGYFNSDNFKIKTHSDAATARRLQNIFTAIEQLRPEFLKNKGVSITTRLEFPRLWGLGSSSTLLYNLATWADINAFRLLQHTFGGSGYDLACAGEFQPILFKNIASTPQWQCTSFQAPFLQNLFLVYLNKKQNSRMGIQRYRQRGRPSDELFAEVSDLTMQFLKATSLKVLNDIIVKHEQLVSGHLNIPPVKTLHFRDFPGAVKSLGAWGGDFVLVTNPYNSTKDLYRYFQKKGFDTILSLRETAYLK